jgi:hypothetical protein
VPRAKSSKAAHQFMKVRMSLRLTMPANQLIVYSLMFDEYPYYLEQRGLYKQSEQMICSKLHMSKNTVGRTLDALEGSGYIYKIASRPNVPTIWHINDTDKDGRLIVTPPSITEPLLSLINLGLERDRLANKKTTTLVCSELEYLLS